MYRWKKKIAPYLFILPNLIIFGIFIVFPALFGFYVSFTEWDVLTSPEFIGLGNFIKLFQSAEFWTILSRTLIYVFSVVPITFGLSMVLAIILDRNIKAKGFFRAIFYLPTMLSFIVIGVSWRWILGNNFGILNYLLDLAGMAPVNWLTNARTATIMVIFATVWARVGYFMVMFIAGLQGIPGVYYEAAEIDGASKWQQFRHITFPLLKPTSLVVVVLSTIQAFKMFGLIKVMTTGGPGDSTTYLVQEIYQQAFQVGDMGYASAMSVMLFIILGLLTIVQFKVSNRGGNAYE
ncbi:carbohydrate ABC transporter permease [Halanaerobium sp. ST460_2HS_T2]|uniref:carbohydrate ABC transporter permease n=1 Tax=Halanaerobium sp. ST460_2HS_T2 TaxID=2183914 RepID=UPI000DF3DCE0|nr:sugar ABC transporter permease [Halanaerobium sp. ST460_2HS_T2]RCW55393.1 carbohydrate ABC transporter membrane protein 1 (CUT1 family) [Halanaerobium sp. ST460_2HS_T2]